MSIKLFTIPGYVHLYRSLLRFCDIGEREARALVYSLNTANLDSFRFAKPGAAVRETGYVAFNNHLLRMNCRPYRTEVQLYKALLTLNRNIIPDALTADQREALASLRCIMRSLEYSFYKAFGVEICDLLTVYSECAAGLLPHSGEPSVCMARDWAALPGA
jgi:hypothetical protein